MSVLKQKYIADLEANLTEAQITILHNFALECRELGFSHEKTKYRCKVLKDIIKTNDKDWLELEKRYHSSKIQYERIRIRYGEERVLELSEKYKKRPRPKPNSHLSRSYWINNGYTEEEARVKVSEIQSKNSRKRHSKPQNYKLSSPISLDFWVHRGYTLVEAEDLRQPYLDKCDTSLTGMIRRHGETIGIHKFHKKTSKRLATMIERHGATIVNGNVSKESLRFFIKLYKTLRRRGIARDDIYWGVKGSREYAMHHDGKNYFYDFTIKSHKVIIEYNNSFWHPRDNTIYNNPFVSRDIAAEKDLLKKTIMEDRGYKFIVVWEDDNHEDKVEQILKEIFE